MVSFTAPPGSTGADRPELLGKRGRELARARLLRRRGERIGRQRFEQAAGAFRVALLDRQDGGQLDREGAIGLPVRQQRLQPGQASQRDGSFEDAAAFRNLPRVNPFWKFLGHDLTMFRRSRPWQPALGLRKRIILQHQ